MKGRAPDEATMGNSFVLKELLRYWNNMSYDAVYISRLRKAWEAEAADKDSPYREAYRLALKQTLM
jgi:hypothetical protein